MSTKSVVAKSRMYESGLKKVEKVVNWGIKSEEKGTRTIQYPVAVMLKVSKLTRFYIRMHQGHELEQKPRINMADHFQI